MNCPKCDTPQARTINSRVRLDPREVWRRRICRACAFRWTTREVPALWLTPKRKPTPQTT